MKLRIICLIILFCSVVFAVPGDLDQTFGNGGSVFATVTGMNPAKGVAIQADGKIVLVGTTFGPDATDDFSVIRLNADGSTDLGFGTNGIVGISFDLGANELATAVAIQSNGKIVVGGSVQFGAQGWDFGVVRLNSNGTIDTGFNGGKVKINIGGDDFANDLVLQPDGKVLITGTMRPTPNTDVPLVRLTASGVLDVTFSGDGITFFGIGEGNNDSGNSIAVQTDGKIIVAGSTREASRGYFVLVRFNPDGNADFGFGFFGFVQTAIGTQFDAANSAAIQPDGKIVAGGTSNSGSGDLAAFVRYNTNGNRDTTFGTDGKVTVDVRPTDSDFIRSVLIQADGKIIGVGASGGSYILVRLNTNGSLDSSFGIGGKVVRNVAPVNSAGSRAVLQSDGKIIAVGDGASSSTIGFTTARFLTAASVPSFRTPFDFDGDSKTDLSVFRPAPGEWWYLKSSNGGNAAFQFGVSTDIPVPADFTGDGKTDIAFFRPSTGFWYVLRSEDFSFYAFPFGNNSDIPVPADFDGDGKADSAVFRPSSLTWYINRSSGGTDILTFGAAGDRPVVGDYDNDGKADIAVFRDNNGAAEWWIRQSSNGSVFAAQFGSATDKAVPGDYTGDGRADIAVWRPSNGNWFIRRSEDSSFYSFPFGSTGDLPVSGDYDGDGKTDPAIFRQTNSTWYIQRSTGGAIIQQFGISGDQPLPGIFVR